MCRQCMAVCVNLYAYIYIGCECIACPKHKTNVVVCFVRCVSMSVCFLFGYEISASEQNEYMYRYDGKRREREREL